MPQIIHCINPDCPRPYPQPGENKFCSGCGARLCLGDRYIPLEHLGSGGFAAIYTVWDLQKQAERVLKVLVETSPKALQLFEQEAAVLQRLKHPGVPGVESDSYFLANLGRVREQPLPCLVMEKICGRTLEDMMAQYPQGCPEALVRDWLYQAVEILRELHRNGIIHRDLKPSNLMLREGTGQLVAIDFGGAKQIGSIPLNAQSSSTRLISPGYSPPEQITGDAVGPAADFYALGKTMIQLLTAQNLEDLQDPVTGEFSWRDRVAVSPELADLLDATIALDARSRPTAADIQRWLVKRTRRRLSAQQRSWQSSPSTPVALAEAWLDRSVSALAVIGRSIGAIAYFFWRVVTTIVFACLDTTQEMILGGVGAAVGAAVGFVLINWTTLGDRFAAMLSEQVPLYLPELQITAWREILLFAIAGLGTALGLTQAGGFGQQRRPFVAGITGTLGYGIGWLIWQVSVSYAPTERLLGVMSAVAVIPLVLGMGLPSHYFVHAVVAAVGTGTVLGSLAWFQFLPRDVLINIFSFSDASWSDFIDSIAFFSLLGVTLGFWLGASYYVLVPILRLLGWR